MQCLGFPFLVSKTVSWLKWHLHWRKTLSFYFLFFFRNAYCCLSYFVRSVCAAECNCGRCVQQFASLSSSKGSGEQLEQHWLCSKIEEQHSTENSAEYSSLTWALITEEDVFCFKFVFLCFKQNCEQYRNFKVTYTDGRKKNSLSKLYPKADTAYLDFQTHISRYSNYQSTVHITRWQLLLSAPLQTQSVCSIFGEHSAVNSFVACVLLTTVQGVTLQIVHVGTWSVVMWSELTWLMWSDFILKWIELHWNSWGQRYYVY